MLLPSQYLRHNYTNTFTKHNGRLPHLYQTLGAAALGQQVNGVHVWTARGDGDIEITGPAGDIIHKTIPKGATFVFAFDLNGVMYWGHSIGGEVVWTFYDNRTQDYSTIVFAGEFPVATLDSTGPRRYPLVDVVIAYHKGDTLCLRYQRERFATEHVIGDIPNGARLRSMGMSAQNRWVFRFDRVLPEGFSLEITEDGS